MNHMPTFYSFLSWMKYVDESDSESKPCLIYDDWMEVYRGKYKDARP